MWQALHGDMSQNIREKILLDFRKGTLQVLVATDVAARGLDIPDVQLVLQAEPPRDIDSYVHRSGRTGRAGKSGTSIVLYEDSKSGELIEKIERHIGLKVWEALVYYLLLLIFGPSLPAKGGTGALAACMRTLTF